MDNATVDLAGNFEKWVVRAEFQGGGPHLGPVASQTDLAPTAIHELFVNSLTAIHELFVNSIAPTAIHQQFVNLLDSVIDSPAFHIATDNLHESHIYFVPFGQ